MRVSLLCLVRCAHSRYTTPSVDYQSPVSAKQKALTKEVASGASRNYTTPSFCGNWTSTCASSRTQRLLTTVQKKHAVRISLARRNFSFFRLARPSEKTRWTFQEIGQRAEPEKARRYDKTFRRESHGDCRPSRKARDLTQTQRLTLRKIASVGFLTSLSKPSNR